MNTHSHWRYGFFGSESSSVPYMSLVFELSLVTQRKFTASSFRYNLLHSLVYQPTEVDQTIE